MSNEKIKKHYVVEGKIDKFTKIEEYQMPTPAIRLNTRLLTSILHDQEESKAYDVAIANVKHPDEVKGILDYIKNMKWRSKAEILLNFIYRTENGKDILIIKLNLDINAPELNIREKRLKNAKVLFLLDDNETIEINKFLKYNREEGLGVEETTYLETDVALLLKLALSNKIDYRIKGDAGILTEDGFSNSDLFRIKGFYNAIFDSEFMKDELLKQVEIDIAEEEKKRLEEQKRKDEKSKKLESQRQNSRPATSSSSSRCFVITATMGDPYHPIVDAFRAYRDRKLLTTEFGRTFVSFYYKVGPYAASIISKSGFLRKLSFIFFVNPIYKRLKNDRNSNKN